jgi:hypothetical protein
VTPRTTLRAPWIFPSARLLRQAAAAILQQQAEITRLHAEVVAAELAYMRIDRDLIEQFLISLDMPENRTKSGSG